MLTQADKVARAKEMFSTTKDSSVVTEAFPSVLMRANLSDGEAVKFKDMYPIWTPGETYKLDWIVRYDVDGELYRIGQPSIVASNVYKPGDPGTESIYSHISFDESGYEEWKEWDGVSGIYKQDQVVSDPFDGGNLYKSKIPNNVWGPPSQQPNYWEKV